LEFELLTGWKAVPFESIFHFAKFGNFWASGNLCFVFLKFDDLKSFGNHGRIGKELSCPGHVNSPPGMVKWAKAQRRRQSAQRAPTPHVSVGCFDQVTAGPPAHRNITFFFDRRHLPDPHVSLLYASAAAD
jgi:hypothetical protein